MSSFSEVEAEAAAVASAAVPVAAAISPLARTIVALVAAALKAEPAIVSMVEQVIADFKGGAGRSGPARLHGPVGGARREAARQMRPSVFAAFPGFITRFEGRLPFMYLDTKGLVTTGVGNLIDPLVPASRCRGCIRTMASRRRAPRSSTIGIA